jgi:hypothetical protein
MQAMTAQQTNDTVVINKLMMEYNTIQQEVGTLKQNILLMLKVIKIFITALIVQGLLMDPTTDVKNGNYLQWFR